MARHQESNPFVKKPWPIRLEETISDDFYHVRRGSSGEGNYELPMPGAQRYEEAIMGRGPYRDVYCHGPCWFRWGVNRSGSAITRGYIARKFANQAVTADSAGTVNTFPDAAQFTEHEEVDNILYILDDAGAAGAAPEGEWATIVSNTAGVLTLQSPYGIASALTAAIASGDTGIIYAIAKLDLLGGAIEREETFGVALAASIADDYWAWYCCKGVVQAKNDGGAMTQGIGLIGKAGGVLDISSTSRQEIMLARGIVDASADQVLEAQPVYFDVIHGTEFTSA